MIDPRSILTYAAGVGLVVALGVAGTQTVRLASAKQALSDYMLAVEQQSEIQREGNRGRAREAETTRAVQAVYRDRFIAKTMTEILYVTEPLAACPVPADAIRMLNDTAACAAEDRSAACGIGDAVRSPG